MMIRLKWLSNLFVILVLASTIICASYSLPVSAQTIPGIYVESSHALSNFPDNVSFNLTVASHEELRSIKLSYQINNSPTWLSVIQHFENHHRMTTRFVLSTSGSNFLTPESTIKYFYDVSDKNGSSLKTPTKEIKYVDPRFEWAKIQIGPLTLGYHDQSDEAIEQLTRDLTLNFEILREFFLIKNPKPINGIIYNHRSELVNELPEEATIPEIYHGFAFLDQQVFLGFGMEHDLIIHESSHLLLAQAMNERKTPLPAWLQEGVSSYMEPSRISYDGYSLSKQTVPLSSMESVPQTPVEIAYFYRKSESVVSFLLQELQPENGVTLFQSFLVLLANSPYPSVNQSLDETFGITIEELDRQWQGSLRGIPSPSRGTEIFQTPSPFLFLDTWLLGGLAIIVVLIVTVKFFKNKIYPQKNEEYTDFGENDPYND